MYVCSHVRGKEDISTDNNNTQHVLLWQYVCTAVEAQRMVGHLSQTLGVESAGTSSERWMSEGVERGGGW